MRVGVVCTHGTSGWGCSLLNQLVGPARERGQNTSTSSRRSWGGLGSRHNWRRIKTVPVRRRLSVGIGIDFRRGHWAASKLTQRCRLHRRLTPIREHQPKSMVRSPRSRLTCLKLGAGNGRASENGAGCARFRQHRRTCPLPRARHRPRPWRSTHSCVTMNVARCYGLFVPQARGRQRRLSGLHCCFVYPLG